jgi:hypothetical protein
MRTDGIMRITIAYRTKRDGGEELRGYPLREEIDRSYEALSGLGHRVALVDVSGELDEVIERLLESAPDLIFNVADGVLGSARETSYPGLYDQLRIPFAGGNAIFCSHGMNGRRNRFSPPLPHEIIVELLGHS